MAYQNYGGYPQQQQPYYPQQPVPDQLAMLRQQPMQMQPPVQQGMPLTAIWVHGEEAMKRYPVAIGQTVLVFDLDSNVYWHRWTESNNQPGWRTFDYTERIAAQNPPVQAAQMPQGDYVTRAEFDALTAKIDVLMQPVPVTIEKEEK